MTNLDKLAEYIAGLIAPPIPIDVDLWDASRIAAFLKVSKRQITDRLAPLPGFPKAYRLPTGGAAKGHPRWKAAEVIQWAEQYREGAGTRRAA